MVKDQGKDRGLKPGGLYGPDGKEWEARPGSGLKRQMG